MSDDLTFTGERFVPGVGGEIVYEHVHRYAFARRYAAGKRVLDAACGEGYGSALLATVAREVTGIDIDGPTIAHARETYRAIRNLTFVQGSAAELPMPDASVDVVVSFETIEHLDASDQPRMLSEFSRVLTDDGVLVLSAPNRPEYSESRGYVNPYHRHEHDRDELERLLRVTFPAIAWHAQRVWLGSTVWREGGGGDAEVLSGDATRVGAADVPAPMYFLVVAARRASALPAHGPALSLFSDAGETELKRAAASVAEAIRLDGLLKGRESVVVERDAQLARAHGHVEHLEGLLAKREPLLAERERIVEERDAQLRDVVQRTERLEALALEREALVAERDALLATANAHVRHLEELCAFREKLVVERDAAIADRDGKIAFREKLVAERDEALTKAADEQAAAERRLARARADDVLARKHIAELEADCARLDRALESQERIIAYRQSLRWWFGLPWMRAKLAWKRLTGA
ncbi:MAG: methyltransferase domain-containing protein [Vicinamibacteria bacterium]|jgi:SAM-dependent methyltransferase